MKIVCDSCGAKYSIADEKVAGKVFKIRCKKCSAVIVVRGDQMAGGDAAGAADAAAAADFGGDAVWHVVVNGDQQGPFSPAQVSEMLSAGTIDWEAYVWREGFDGWIPAREAQDLVEAVTRGSGGDGYSAPAYDVSSTAGYAAPGPDPFAAPAASAGYGGGGGGGGGGDLFASSAASPFESAPVASRQSRDAGADLFAPSTGSPFAGQDDEEASAGAARAAHGGGGGGGSMTGARNENSVLFSLSNLQALATGPAEAGGGAPRPGPSAPTSPALRAGAATTEGSGLIDIRALAGAGAVPPPSAGGSPNERVDDLLSIGAGAPGLGSALGSPVLAPVEQEKSNKGLIAGVIGVATVFAIAAVAIVVILKGGSDETTTASAATPAAQVGAINPATATPTTPSTSAGAQPATAANTQAAGSAPTPSAVDTPQQNSGSTPSGNETASARTEREQRERRDRGDRHSDSPPAQQQAQQQEAPHGDTPPAGRPRGNGSIDDLLNQALNTPAANNTQREQRESSGSSNLPETPPRDAVASALRGVQGAVRACANGQSGVATVAVTVSGSSGRVTNATVTGEFAGTSVGSCIARAVRGATFPRFSRPTFSVNFPYRL